MDRKRLKQGFGREDGQSLVVIAISMVVLLGISAVAIDVASWYVTRHKAQVAADSAALAGANCMAHGGTTTSCATTPGSYVLANGFSSVPSVQFNQPVAGQITVKVTGTGSNFFTSALGFGSPNISATSVASWYSQSSQNCSASQQSSGDCYLAFASSPTSTVGVTSSSNNAAITGGLWSNCSVTISGNKGGGVTGPVNYGNGSGCSTAYPGATQSPPDCFPIDYSGLTANPSSCGGTDVTPGLSASTSCTAANTFSGNTYTFTPTSPGPGLYCLTNPGAVATITGTFSPGAGGITVIAPAFNLSSNSGPVLYPYQSSSSSLGSNNQLVLYQYSAAYTGWVPSNGGCSSVGSFKILGNQSFGLNGYVFAPCANFTYSANNSGPVVGFIEAYSVNLDGAQFTGTGPPVSSGGGVSTPPVDQLVQ